MSTKLRPQTILRRGLEKIERNKERTKTGLSFPGIKENKQDVDEHMVDAQDESMGDETDQKELGEFLRQLSKQKISLSGFKYPGSSQSYNNVELVRHANANANLQRHIFDTSF